jgi:hypothetical protein
MSCPMDQTIKSDISLEIELIIIIIVKKKNLKKLMAPLRL